MRHRGVEYCRHIAGFATGGEVAQLERWIAPHRQRFREAVGFAGLGPKCRQLTGVQLEQWLPEVVAYGEERVRPVVEAFAGGPLETPADRGRARRIQVFDQPQHEFRWHYDISPYAALLTLRTAGGAETQVIPPQLSRWLRPAYYPLAWAPQLLSMVPRQHYATASGDLLVMRGRELLHRGVSSADGERVLLVFAFATPGWRPNPLRARLARYVNARTAAP